MRDWPAEPNPRHPRAVFLDRDGTLNIDTHFPHRVESLQLIPDAIEGLKLLAALPLHIIVVSNQAGIALGIFTREQMSQFNAELRSIVDQAGARIDAFYFCPHLETKHLPQGMSPCECSKPSPGMLLEAAKEFKLNLSRSFIVGDKTSDIAAGESAGCMTILLQTGKAGREEGALPVVPKRFARDLYEAALIIQSYLERELPTQQVLPRHTKV